MATAAWFGWGEELYAAGITIRDFEVAYAEVKAAAQAENPSLAWLDDVPTKVATAENVVYDGEPVTAHDWVFEQMGLADIGVDLEPQAMADQLMTLLARAVDLAMANGGSLAGVSPTFETEEGSTVTSSESTDGSDGSDVDATVLFVNQAPVANDDGIYDVAWNRAFTMPDTRSINILANDFDMDGPQPMQAFKVTDPSNGTVTVTINGGFTYTPDTGFWGMDSFTYKVNDGLADSNVATVNIRVIGVNLTIADGQSGSTLPEEPAPNNETSRGAYTVANSNDTDGDGVIDGTETQVVATAAGQPEKDLMEVWVYPPTYVPPGTNPQVHVFWSGVTLWTHSSKNMPIALPPMQSWHPTVDQLPMQVWAEATQSTSLRDLSISLSYNIPGIFGHITSDLVRATGIWSTVTNVAHDVSNVAGTGVGELWEPGTTFADIEPQPQDAVNTHGGAGLRPIAPAPYGVRNVILIQFTVTPSRNIVADGRWEADGVFFDPTRQIEKRHWTKPTPTSAWTPDDIANPPEDFPTQVDFPNDDTQNGDESPQVTDQNHVYVYDDPRWTTNVPDAFARASRRNFFEFMRVGIGARPLGENLSGSRASPKYVWHDAMTLVENGPPPLVWVRTSDNPESFGVNSIGPDHVNLNP